MNSKIIPAPDVRNTELSLIYNGKEISADVWPFVADFQYIDRTIHDQMDEISVTFQNVPGLWSRGWWPEQGAKFKATIKTRNWFTPGDNYTVECGTYEIDDLSDSGPPSIFTVKAIAVGITHPIRRQLNSQARENITVSGIAGEIAGRHGFKLFFESQYDPTLDRFDQKNEDDLAFIKRLCQYAGLMLKITDGKIVIFQGEEYDAKAPEMKITRGMDGYISHSFNANAADVYSACEIQYYDAAKKEFLTYRFTPEGISGTKGKGKKDKNAEQISEPKIGQVLKINQRVKSLAEAEALAKSALRSSNMRAVRGDINLIGHPLLFSGMNIEVSGFGRWDSVTWQIEEATHAYNAGSGYTTGIQIRGVLNGF
jgi:phage protein D